MFSNPDLYKFIFGRLTLDQIPYHEPILVATFTAVALGGIALLAALTYFRVWGYLWKEWLTSIDHKKIGIMYVVLALIMLLRGFSDALMMRLQQAIAFNGSEGYLPPHHYDQVFTAHGVIMIFFVAMPFVTGLMNLVVPLQIGARDVSFPFLNNFSFWMTTAGAIIIMISLFIGEFAKTGWLAYPPLSGIAYSPDVGVDYYIWGLQVAGIGTTLSGINLITEYLSSNITLLRWMIGEGYGDARTLERRAQAMEAWIANPELMVADADAEYAEIIEIDLNDIKEPVLCAPNDPDDARLLSSVAGEKIDEVFIGSCMTNIGHFRAAGKLLDQVKGQLPTRLWLSPPTKMDAHQLTEEGYYGIYGKAGARMEMPGCSLCMGNQARVEPNSTVVSTSTRNFPNRLGDGANVYLASAELASVASILGRLPTVEEYMAYAKEIDTMASDVYRYLSFDQIAEFREAAANANIPVVQA